MTLSRRRVDFQNGYTVWLRAPFHSGGGRLMTLSEGGAYVATALPLLPQAQLRVSIEVPELERTVGLEAVVAWENRGERRPSPQPEGYGLRFLRVPRASATAIRWLLRHDERRAQERERRRQRERELAAVKEASLRRETLPTRSLSSDEIEEAMERARASLTSERREGRGSVSAGGSRMFPESPGGPPYRLEPDSVAARVPASTPGVFILAYDRTLDALVGRADVDLRTTLSAFIGEYSFFHFEPVPARKERFERECELFHRLGGDRGQLDNREHPLPPAGPQLKCPVCVKERLG